MGMPQRAMNPWKSQATMKVSPVARKAALRAMRRRRQCSMAPRQATLGPLKMGLETKNRVECAVMLRLL